MLEEEIKKLLTKYPQVLYGYTAIEFSDFFKDYASCLMMAVPYGEQLTLDDYSEEKFEEGIAEARKKIEAILIEVEALLQKHRIQYFIPPVAQSNETELRAPFSFKYAAMRAGIGWMGKNDVVITEKYGPRIRLSAVLIDHPFVYGKPYLKSLCPDECSLCIKVCPYKALKGTSWDQNKHREELINYHLCNEKRSLFLAKHGRKNACGLCMTVCPFGQKGRIKKPLTKQD